MSCLPYKLTAIALSLALASTASQASFVRNDIDYQYFRDFAENKGQFQIGATDVPIFNKNGAFIGNMLAGVSMPDLKSVSRNDGVATLISNQFITTVKHNVGVNRVQFGDSDQNPDAHHFSYEQVSKHPDTNPNLDADYQVIRLRKLVTEVAPMEMSRAGQDFEPYGDKNRFSHYIRLGSGTQGTRDPNQHLAGAYQFLTGGSPLELNSRGAGSGLFNAIGSVFDNTYGPMATYASRGDSGSPLLGFDKKLNRWVLVALARSYTGDDGIRNVYVLSRPDFLRQKDREYIVDVPRVNGNEIIHWRNTANGMSMQDDRRTTVLPDGVGLDNKALHFAGASGVLQLEESINQGAGGLFFNNSFTVRGKTGNETWIGSGVVVAGDRTINWQVKNPAGDRLSKLGTGTLLVNGQGVNPGDISVGEGRVVLSQQADASGQVQAFNQIGLTSGRGTVVLGADHQFDPDKFYFGFRGGRLDMNGRSLTFKHIQNTDDGAKIVNHNTTTPSELTITGLQAAEQDIVWQRWREQQKSPLSLYEYVNTWQNHRKDYFVLSGNPNAYFPTDGNSNDNWEYLGSNKNQAIKTVLERYITYSGFNGFFGETDRSKPNGVLNVNYRPAQEKLFLLSGGVKLNGSMNVENGKMLLSGRPTPHAYDHLTHQDVVKNNDWLNREFAAHYWNVKNNATLYSGRNVSRLEGTFTASQNAKLSLGHVNGKTPTCIRSDYTGSVGCNFQERSASTVNNIPQTQIHGAIYLNDHSHLDLGKAHYHGKIFANNGTSVKMYRNSEWTMPGSSRVYDLAMELGAKINLHPWYNSISQTQLQQGIGNFNNLYINGNLTGTGQFNFLTNAQRGIGDLITIAGSTDGNFKLGLKNTGAEPNNASPLRLIRLTNADPTTDRAKFSLEKHFVDLGTYRYVLAKMGNDYRLYSPLREVEGSNNIAFAEAHNKQISQLESQITQKNQQISQASQQLSTQQDGLTNVQTQLTAQEKEKAAAQASYNHYKGQLKGRMPVVRANYLRRKVAEATQRINTAQSNINRLNTQLNELKQTVNTLQQNVAMTTQQRNEMQLSLQTLKSQPYKPSAEQIRKETEKLCAQYGISQSLCNSVIDGTPINDPTTTITHHNSGDDGSTDETGEHPETDIGMPHLDYTQRIAKEKAKSLEQMIAEEIDIAPETGNTEVQAIDADAQAVLGNYRQADLISQYANAGLSELSAQGQNLIQIRQGLQRQLLAQDEQDLSVWTNYQRFDSDNESNLFRRYEQQTNLTQLGAEAAATEQLRLGLAFSQAKSDNQFDDNMQGKSRLNMLTAYAKWQLPQQWMITLDTHYGQAKNHISQAGEESHFKRHIWQAGVNIAKNWQWLGVDIRPSVGVHYNRIGGVRYQLDQANIEQQAVNFASYQLGLKLAKTFELNGVKLTPSVESQYIDLANKKLFVNVNDHALEQRFDSRTQHQLGLDMQYNQWSFGAQAGVFKGSDTNQQKFAGVHLKYEF